MTKKELDQLRAMTQKKAFLEDRIRSLRESVQRYAAPISDMPHAPAWKDPMAEYAAKLDALEREIADLLLSIESRIIEAEKAIDGLPTEQARIIRMRYCQGYSWRKIIRKTHYSERQVFRLHGLALKALEQESWQ